MKDRELWKEIYEKYAKRMLTVCLRYSPGREEAEDFMHEGFMQVFRSLDKFTDRGEGSLRAWMERIMINTCLQGYRKKDVLRDSKPVETVPDTEDDSYLNEAAERVPIDVLQRFIGDLPQGYRTVFNLYVFEGLSHKEIAQQLGIRERTSSSQFYRAKCLLVRLIKEYERKQR
ncbi:MAG TPA: sigma-70 family RNA polymerase sigma factor [Bacteroidales bacterium]|mgnify:FL=1|jgi:RNA polymerase sigma-70 factor (ECF subfamily)|nr:sigma-70 family RNA polymerase sigma factor [Bacteroidales bacterium]MCZ2416506.1 sigma-70 family RNA polymerase sigma factor [Burkholderiales bacterium]OQC56187.1 MAG: ECF RNA polymerase sigma factor SigE [Bacteroidetes bacterium ADurb.Bin013]MBV6455627.1 ECF RNA polymerase sigma factor SigE [Bacteroidales bacterium]MCZ2315905.1 sigma-70 family RNA polymerase sigma factor [Bacteroidales bacterium]